MRSNDVCSCVCSAITHTHIPTTSTHTQKRKELSATTCGQVLLLEYLEEQPLLLPQMGMGARLTTLYRKTSANDTAHHQLRSEGKAWQVGAVHALNAEDESPLLGNVKRGAGDNWWGCDKPCGVCVCVVSATWVQRPASSALCNALMAYMHTCRAQGRTC